MAHPILQGLYVADVILQVPGASKLGRTEIDFVPALSQTFVNSVQSALSEERQGLRRSPQRDHAQTPVRIVRPRLQPTGVHVAMIFFEHLREFRAVSPVNVEEKLCSPTDLLDKVTHAARPRSNLGEEERL